MLEIDKIDDLAYNDKIILAKTSTDPLVLRILSKDENYHIKTLVSINENISKETLGQLARLESTCLKKIRS